jgi:ATP-dependent DNA helicase RecG
MDAAVKTALDAVYSGVVAKDAETELLDFKEDHRDGVKGTLRVLLDAALCLANAKGGHVVLGVRDKAGGPTALIGTDLDPETVRQSINTKSHPRLLVEVEAVDYQRTRLLVVSVPEGREIHADAKGRAPRRIGTDCVPLDPAGQARLREERSAYDWSHAKAGSARISPEALAAARRRFSASTRPERRALSALSDADLARALGVVDSGGNLLNAGAVLLGEEQCKVTYTYRESPAGEPLAVEKLNGPLLVVYDRIMELIRLRRRLTPVTLPDGQQLQVEDFPELAVREALTNALIHRDYQLADAVTVDHSPSVLAITSPGPLVAGVNPDNILTHPSKPRNRCLANAASISELAEEIGRGVDRMYREMIRSGRPTPSITEAYDHTRVALIGDAPNTSIARYVGQLPAEVRDDTDAMIIILKLCGTRTVTAEQMAPLLQKGVDEAEASLRHLARDVVAVIEPTRQTFRRARPVYRLREDALKQLGSAVPYARHTADEIERRVVLHVREYGRITNATVQNLFNVKSDRANQILKELRERQILTKTSEAQRGPSVEYGPGDRFPPREASKRRTTKAKSENADQATLFDR